jgi:hypothetical protein
VRKLANFYRLFLTYFQLELKFAGATKKREIGLCFSLDAYRFLSSKNSSNPTATMAMIMPIPKPITYVSVIGAGVGVGGGVAAGASSTFMAVSA